MAYSRRKTNTAKKYGQYNEIFSKPLNQANSLKGDIRHTVEEVFYKLGHFNSVTHFQGDTFEFQDAWLALSDFVQTHFAMLS